MPVGELGDWVRGDWLGDCEGGPVGGVCCRGEFVGDAVGCPLGDSFGIWGESVGSPCWRGDALGMRWGPEGT